MELIEVKEVDESLLQEIIRRIVPAIDPVRIILFGSYAYGTHGKGSDLDILVVMDNRTRSRREIASEIYGLLAGILIPKDIVVVKLQDIEEWKNVPMSFITSVVKKGKVLYERED
jgi:predicted nucleotidyltransferase